MIFETLIRKGITSYRCMLCDVAEDENNAINWTRHLNSRRHKRKVDWYKQQSR